MAMLIWKKNNGKVNHFEFEQCMHPDTEIVTEIEQHEGIEELTLTLSKEDENVTCNIFEGYDEHGNKYKGVLVY